MVTLPLLTLLMIAGDDVRGDAEDPRRQRDSWRMITWLIITLLMTAGDDVRGDAKHPCRQRDS